VLRYRAGYVYVSPTSARSALVDQGRDDTSIDPRVRVGNCPMRRAVQFRRPRLVLLLRCGRHRNKMHQLLAVAVSTASTTDASSSTPRRPKREHLLALPRDLEFTEMPRPSNTSRAKTNASRMPALQLADITRRRIWRKRRSIGSGTSCHLSRTLT